MNRTKKIGADLSKTRNDVAARTENVRYAVEPTLYSSIVQTESKLKRISLSRLKPKPIANKAGVKEVNFPLAEHVYNYEDLVDVGLNSGVRPTAKPKSREVRSMKSPAPKLSDYYQPSFDNVQRIQMDIMKTTPELTVQYDGLAVSRLLNEIDNLSFK